jgi:heme/copper-type cytochrome/quinol oxidase subunit 1
MRRLVPGVIALAGYVLVLVGVVVFNLAGVVDQPPYDFGWSAYAPLEETRSAYQSALTYASVDGGTVLWTGGHLVGAGLAMLGALVLAGVGGWLLGHRSGLRGSPRG